MLKKIAELGGHFFPLLKKSKVPPKEYSWREKSITLSEAENRIDLGGNVGYAIGERVIVLDFDPLRGGYKALERLAEFEDIDIDKIQTLKVLTGGKPDVKGLHAYFKIPHGRTFRRLSRDERVLYPGLDIQAHGQYVLAPGCFVADYYEVLDDSPVAELPLFFTDAVKPLELSETGDLTLDEKWAELRAERNQLTGAELLSVLGLLPVEEYASNDLWLPMLMAAHYATAGSPEGLDAFIEWSTSDPQYADDGRSIEKRWNSLSLTDATAITTGTLYHEVKSRGFEWPIGESKKSEPVQDNDTNVILTGTFHDALKIEINDVVTQWKDEIVEEERSAGRIPFDTLVSLIDKVEAGTSVAIIESYAAAVGRLPSMLEQEKLISKLSTAADCKESSIKQIIKKALKNDHKGDLGESDSWAIRIFKRVFGNGRFIWCDPNSSILWRFDGARWRQISDEYVHAIIYHYVVAHCEVTKREVADVEPLLNKVTKLLRTKAIRQHDLGDQANIVPVFNLKNGELIFDPKNGDTEFRQGHDPESRQTSVIDAVYDPEARAPKFEKYLKSVFSEEADRDDLIRHFLEVMAYSIQPYKDMPLIVILQGWGENGKTVALKVLGALLNDGAAWMSIGDLESDRFATFNLVGKNALIDDDVSARTRLCDGLLKKLSETKPQIVRKMHHEGISTVVHVTPIMACNGFPTSADISRGLMRRMTVIPFRRRFKEHEKDPSLAVDIIRYELAGVLNMLVEALTRLRKRGHFLSPESSRTATDKWAKSANIILAYIDSLTHDPDATLSADLAYSCYLDYCNANTHKFTVTKQRFLDDLESTGGYRVEAGTIYGLDLPRSLKSGN